jgi:hypothetical protein
MSHPFSTSMMQQKIIQWNSSLNSNDWFNLDSPTPGTGTSNYLPPQKVSTGRIIGMRIHPGSWEKRVVLRM